MAGPNLEVFKFGLYLFFPVAMMFHYGNPDWYAKHVLPYRDKIWPPPEQTNHIPHDRALIRAELERLKAERQARKRSNQGAE